MLDHEKAVSRDASVVVPCNSGADDALLLTCRPDGTDQRIQITTDCDYDEALRAEYLTKYGHVPAFGPMRRVNKTRDALGSEGETLPDQIRRLAARKAIGLIQRNESKTYAEGTWLIVQLRDATVGNRGDLREFVCMKVREECLQSQFERIYPVSPNDQGFCTRAMMKEQRCANLRGA